MKKFLEKNGGLILFYLFIILCVVMVNFRFEYLNNSNEVVQKNVYALNN